MSKKKFVQKKLWKGRFYVVHEGSPRGHPGKLYWKNDNKNLYLFIKTGTTPTPETIVLLFPTEKGISKSYVYKKPVLAKRRDVGGELPNMSISKSDKQKLREISLKAYAETPSIRKKDRYHMRKMKKKPRY